MRNNSIVSHCYTPGKLAILTGAAVAPLLSGCMDVPSRQVLNRGYAEMKAQNYDAADADADEFLRAHPDGSGVAEAWYLKGRVDEARAQDNAVSPTADAKREWLDRAKEAYQEGLRPGAPSQVRAQIRTGIANVDFYEENYADAIKEWQAAYENVPSEDTKAWVLYQIGRSQQRLGQFELADKTFAQVQRDFPGSDAATRAASRIGMNAFYVKVKKYNDVGTAEKAAEKLRGEGLPASRVVDAGWEIVHIGPLPSYADAKATQSRIAREYPDTVISP